ncbi:MAG: transporter substrate-binding protein [Acidimicrobiaceae bacterium]|nr:transporter substrate-binding protein [Acidimicrobiaceae bacterium]
MRSRLDVRGRGGASRRSVAARVGALSVGALALTGAAAYGTAGASPAASKSLRPAVSKASGTSCKKGAVKLTMWGWAAGYNLAVDEFNKTHSDVCVVLENDGATTAEYTKIQDAEKAGSGAPDVAEIEYFVLPSFEITHTLANLVPYGVNAYRKNEVAVAWSQVSQGSGVYAMPVDVGPLAFYYNSTMLAKYGISVPKTWAQYATDAATLKKDDPGAYLGTLDWADSQPVLAMMQQYGAFPFKWNGGSKLTISFTGKSETAFANFWQKLIGSGEANSTVDFSPAQWTAWDSGTDASRFSPAWGPVGMQLSIKNTIGSWRAAPMPTTSSGTVQSGNWGGSTIAVLASSKHPKQAAEFAEWFGGTAASWKILSGPIAGAYPGYKPVLDSNSFLSTTLPISKSQHFQGVFAQAAKHMVSPEWPPIMNYVNTIWPTAFAGVANGSESLPAAFKTMQNDLVKYAKAQGFNVSL